MSYSSELETLFREAPEGTGRLQSVWFGFQGSALRYTKSYTDKVLRTVVGGPSSTFAAASFEVDLPEASEDGSQVISITFPSAGQELYRILNFYNLNRNFVTVDVKYFEHYIDGNTINIDPAYTIEGLSAFSIDVNGASDVRIQASTDNMNDLSVGEIYTYDKFYALRNL